MATQKYILAQASDSPAGLYCLNLENGETKWWFNPDGNTRGHTPAVDQTNGYVYFQTRNRLWKLNALTGAVLDFAVVSSPSGSGMGSGNTILVDDANGYFVAGVWNDYVAYGGAVKVYDANLELKWEDKNLNMNLKTVMAYHDGVLFCGKGNAFAYPEVLAWYTGQKEDCTIKAYDITDGTVLWEYECDAAQNFNSEGGNRGFIEVIYCNGYIIANTIFGTTTEIHIVDASDGTLVKKLTDATGAYSACAPSAIAGGRLYIPELVNDTIRVYQIGTGTFEDWNIFGSVPQLNHNVANSASLATIAETPALVDAVSGGDQGTIIIASIAYSLKNNNCVKYDPDTLVVADNFDDIGAIYDSTPLMVENLAGEDVLIIKESENKRAIAINPTDGSRLWNSVSTIEGNLFFGFNYYVAPYTDIVDGMTDDAMVVGLNNNFAALNSLISGAATIGVLSSVSDISDINDNIASLNANGVAVAVDTIVDGMTGQSFINLINGFVTDYSEAN